jgi:hypothetical protein
MAKAVAALDRLAAAAERAAAAYARDVENRLCRQESSGNCEPCDRAHPSDS